MEKDKYHMINLICESKIDITNPPKNSRTHILFKFTWNFPQHESCAGPQTSPNKIKRT